MTDLLNWRHLFGTLIALIIPMLCHGQSFYFGSDLSYVNQMDDCGVVYRDKGIPKDCYEIFADHGTNLVRLRLWHTPSWQDTLNNGRRYSDFTDVKRAILRAKAENMAVLLDFHLSDFWADPNRQILPKAWASVVDKLPVLQDSLYRYVYSTLNALNDAGLMPEMVQVGNETNRGILLSEATNNAGWTLNWSRNAALFNTAIKAVRDVAAQTGKSVKVALHVADPAGTAYMMNGFWQNGVRDFDIIGMSYYWAWHAPTTIAQTGDIIHLLKNTYPGKSVMIFETGYIWTLAGNDPANNIINKTHPDYAPPSPQNQKKWLTDLTQMVINKGGSGVIYWEPAWVSSKCRTPWGQGSHQENATFFDFDENVLSDGGLNWPLFPYKNLLGTQENSTDNFLQISHNGSALSGMIRIQSADQKANILQLRLYTMDGKTIATQSLELIQQGEWKLPALPPATYVLVATGEKGERTVKKLLFR